MANKKSLTIDKVGFDVEAMAKLSEKEFVEIHLENDAICPHQPKDVRFKYLKDCYASIKEANEPKAEKPAEKAPEVNK